MGLLDYADSARKKLRGLLGDMPIVQAAQGQANVSLDGLRNAMMAMRPFQGGADTAYEAALNIGPMGLGKIVYHGSPHKFDKFDASKIGTGEGAQAYGHGVYLADKQGIAQGYADTLSDTKGEVMYRGNVMRDIYGPEATLKRGILTGKSPGELAKEYAAARSHMKDLGESKDADFWNAASKAAKRIREEDIKVIKAEGQLYKADLPDEWIPKMLDWDKPIGEQKELIEALRKSDATGVGGRGLGWRGAPEGMWDRAMASPSKTGEWLYREIANNDPKATAEAMRALGIPGIRYLDGGSRGKGQGTYNYVVFPGLEDQVKILERNGVPLGLLGK